MEWRDVENQDEEFSWVRDDKIDEDIHTLRHKDLHPKYNEKCRI